MQLTRDNIRTALAALGGTAAESVLLKAFGGRSVRHGFERLLAQMIHDGDLRRERKRLVLARQGPMLRGRLSAHRDGYGFVTPDTGGSDIFIPARHLNGALHGDLVEVSAAPGLPRYEGKREGRVNAVIERGITRVTGRYEENRYGAVVIPDDQRLNLVIAIPDRSGSMVQDGQQVVAGLTAYPAGGRPAEGRILEVLGQPDDPEVEIQSVIRRFDLPHTFSPEALAEADRVPDTIGPEETDGRTDLRHLRTVTIDGETARDFDDAVSLEHDGDNFRLRVSIADVSRYVSPGSHLDREAYLRGTSVYFPDRCIPMLPERLSNGICSLNPGVDRLTMTAEMLIDRQGTLLASSFYPSIINSCARLTYTVVKQIIVDHDPTAEEEYRSLTPMLHDMKELALILMAMRRRRGSIDFDLPEPEIIIGLTGRTEGIIRAERTLAHQLIEEFMLAANEAVAAFITRKGMPFLYRVHEQPAPERLTAFQELVYGFGYDVPVISGRIEPGAMQRLLEQADGKPEERLVNYALLRCMKQARYSPDNPGHFGLASPCYCHFTSPIRRYPDLVVHRILEAALAAVPGKPSGSAPSLSETAEHTSRRERIAMEAERDVVELMKLRYMERHEGEEFNGIIAGVAAFGLFVELDELFVEGLVHITALTDDFYTYDEKRHTLRGRNSSTVFHIGDRVRVRVVSVNPGTRRIEFLLTGHTVSPLAAAPDGSSRDEEYRRLPVRGRKVKTAPTQEKRPAAVRRPGKKGSGGRRGRRGGR